MKLRTTAEERSSIRKLANERPTDTCVGGVGDYVLEAMDDLDMALAEIARLEQRVRHLEGADVLFRELMPTQERDEWQARVEQLEEELAAFKAVGVAQERHMRERLSQAVERHGGEIEIVEGYVRRWQQRYQGLLKLVEPFVEWAGKIPSRARDDDVISHLSPIPVTPGDFRRLAEHVREG